MNLLWLFSFILFFYQDVPYKPKEEFELKLDLHFKQRPAASSNTVELEKKTLPSSGMPAPYLYLNLKVLKPAMDEVRVKVTQSPNATLMSRKFDPSVIVKLDLGFTDDIKDRVSAHHYFITFFSKARVPLSKIEIFFEPDGTYLVNGEKRGRL
jgi:hypothetical protein